MLHRLRNWLRPRLADGCWYPAFRKSVGRINARFSLRHKFKRWLAAGEVEAPKGASELYQLVLLVVATGWVILLTHPLLPVLAAPLMQIAGAGIATYFIIELFVFSLDWIFVAELPLESYRRSLATFLVSLAEIAFLFFILLSLGNCIEQASHPLLVAYTNLAAMAGLRLVSVADTTVCIVAAHFQRLLAAILMLIIVASLVGAVIRPEKGDEKIGSQT